MVGKHLTSQELEDLIKASDNIVFFGGAGMSTESGIPDFRSQHGLYNQKYIYPAEEILSYPFFQEKPDVFYDFYREKIVNCSIKAKPNLGHEQLAKWEKEGKLKAVVTQNIDTLHEQAGSKNVYHLHGKIEDNFCSKCHKYFNLDYITRAEDSLAVYQADLENLERELEAEIAALTDKYTSEAENCQEIQIKAKKQDILVKIFALVWLPYQQRPGQDDLALFK